MNRLSYCALLALIVVAGVVSCWWAYRRWADFVLQHKTDRLILKFVCIILLTFLAPRLKELKGLGPVA